VLLFFFNSYLLYLIGNSTNNDRRFHLLFTGGVFESGNKITDYIHYDQIDIIENIKAF